MIIKLTRELKIELLKALKDGFIDTELSELVKLLPPTSIVAIYDNQRIEIIGEDI